MKESNELLQWVYCCDEPVVALPVEDSGFVGEIDKIVYIGPDGSGLVDNTEGNLRVALEGTDVVGDILYK